MQVNYDALIQTDFGAIALNSFQSLNSCAVAIELLASSHETYLPKSNIPHLNTYVTRLQAYLINPNTQWSIPTIAHGTAFQQRVWQAIFDIPVGQTKTYGQIADQLKSGPRAVANACGANTLPILIPCHRVVAQNGLGGFMQSKAGGTAIKKWLLQHEGCTQYD